MKHDHRDNHSGEAMIPLRESDYFQRFNAAIENDQKEEALAIAKEMVGKYGNNPDSYYCLGLIHEICGNITVAISVYWSGIETDERIWNADSFPDDVDMSGAFALDCYITHIDTLLRLGTCYRSQGMIDRAIEVYKACLSKNSDNEQAIEALAELESHREKNPK